MYEYETVATILKLFTSGIWSTLVLLCSGELNLWLENNTYKAKQKKHISNTGNCLLNNEIPY